MPETKFKDSLDLGFYVVGFFDLLGQQDRLRQLRGLPNRDDPAEMEKTRQILRSTYGAVMSMRTFFVDGFHAFAKSREGLDMSQLSPEQRAQFATLTNREVKFQGISDSVVAYLPLASTDNAKLAVRGIMAVLGSAALTHLSCLAHGYPIRGGIELGLGVEPGDGEIYGPALARAYAIESNIANYARIVIGEELVKYLNLLSSQAVDGNADVVTKVAKGMADNCIRCMALDDDGLPFLDYLGPYFKEILGDPITANLVDAAYSQVVQGSDQYKQAKNSKVAFKYTLLRNYFDDRMPLWADVPRVKRSEMKS